MIPWKKKKMLDLQAAAKKEVELNGIMNDAQVYDLAKEMKIKDILP